MIRVGAPVALRSGEIPGYPVMTVVRIDEKAQKVQIRFSRPPGVAGYSYLFWRNFAEIQEFVNTIHNLQMDSMTVAHTTGDQGGEDDGSSTKT